MLLLSIQSSVISSGFHSLNESIVIEWNLFNLPSCYPKLVTLYHIASCNTNKHSNAHILDPILSKIFLNIILTFT